MDNVEILKKNNKSIVIYNPLSNVGHFDSWCRIFVNIFLECGWAVVVVTRNSKTLSNQFEGSYTPNLLILDPASNMLINENSSIMELIISKIKVFQFLGSVKLNDRRVNQSLSNICISFMARLINYFARKFEYFLSKFFPNKLKVSFNNPVEFASDINLIVKMLGRKPSIVLNMYLDLYNTELKNWEKFSQEMSCSWAGIHMDTSHSLKNRPYSQSKTLKVIYTINDPLSLDNKFTQDGVDFQWLPDVTDISLPPKVSQIVQDIEKLAAGRKIIFLGGAIGGSKNLSLWSELFFNLDHREWYFVQIGKIEYPTLTSKDLDGLDKLQSSKIENIYISDAYLPEESAFNEVMSISAIIWGLYRDFDRSSNILTKSALLSKPIIVSNRFLMGQRVNKYKIGVAVSETNVDEVITGINGLINNPVPKANFQCYANIYSASALSKKLNDSLLRVIS